MQGTFLKNTKTRRIYNRTARSNRVKRYFARLREVILLGVRNGRTLKVVLRMIYGARGKTLNRGTSVRALFNMNVRRLFRIKPMRPLGLLKIRRVINRRRGKKIGTVFMVKPLTIFSFLSNKLGTLNVPTISGNLSFVKATTRNGKWLLSTRRVKGRLLGTRRRHPRRKVIKKGKKRTMTLSNSQKRVRSMFSMFRMLNGNLFPSHFTLFVPTFTMLLKRSLLPNVTNKIVRMFLRNIGDTINVIIGTRRVLNMVMVTFLTRNLNGNRLVTSTRVRRTICQVPIRRLSRDFFRGDRVYRNLIRNVTNVGSLPNRCVNGVKGTLYFFRVNHVPGRLRPNDLRFLNVRMRLSFCRRIRRGGDGFEGQDRYL